MNGFNWPALMQVGLRSLRLTPAAFWALTPAELALMLGQGAAMAPMGRGGLDRLMQAFPDRMKGQADD
jgi:uncharacterized phage protein (TIGR02216 family)